MGVQIKFPPIQIEDTLYIISGIPRITKAMWDILLPHVHNAIVKNITEIIEKEENIKLGKPTILLEYQPRNLKKFKVI